MRQIPVEVGYQKISVELVSDLIEGTEAPETLWQAFAWERSEEGTQYWLDASNQPELTADNIAKLRILLDNLQSDSA